MNGLLQRVFEEKIREEFKAKLEGKRIRWSYRVETNNCRCRLIPKIDTKWCILETASLQETGWEQV